MSRRSSLSSASSSDERSAMGYSVTIGLEYNEIYEDCGDGSADYDSDGQVNFQLSPSALWYTIEECNAALQHRSQNDRTEDRLGGTSSQCILRTCHNMKTPSIESLSENATKRHNITRRRAIDAVKKEQRRQMKRGIRDDELLATIYQGYNITSIRAARRQGERAARIAEDILYLFPHEKI